MSQINGVSPFAAARQCGRTGRDFIWLSGYRSEMESTKATALDAEAEKLGLGLLRFDYSGHGRSDARLDEGTITRWLEETLHLIGAESDGPQILVGSSMGGYLALLAARALNAPGAPSRIKGLVLVAPAVDFTEALIWARAPDEAKRAIMEEGAWLRPSPYASEPDRFTRALIEDGRKHLLLGAMIRTHAPVVVLQGMMDEDVPYTHALALMQRSRRSRDADPHQGRRPPPVAPAGSRAPVRGDRADGLTREAGTLTPHVAPKRCRFAP